MNIMIRSVALATALGLTAMPTLVFAQATDPATMTCADFTALDDAGKTTAIDAMHAASPEGATPMDDAAKTAAVTKVTTGCETTPDGTAMEAMTAM